MKQGDKIPVIEFEAKDHRLKSRNAVGLRTGTRALFSVILDQRELLIKMTENEQPEETDGNQNMSNEDCIDDCS